MILCRERKAERSGVDRSFTRSLGRGGAPGFTMIEILVTLMLVVVIGLTAYLSLGNMLPKMRLTRSVRDVENLLVRAQTEAFSRSSNVGVQFTEVNGEVLLELYLDGNANLQRDAVGVDPVLATTVLRSSVLVVRDACNPFDLVDTCGGNSCRTVFFDVQGQAVQGTSSAYAVNQPTMPADYEILLYSDRLPDGYKVREVEVLSTGLVSISSLGKPGNALPPNTSGGTQANQPGCPP